MPWWICCRNTTWHHAWHIALKLNSSCFIIDCCFELTWAHQKKQNEFSLKPAQCTRWVGHLLFDICLLIKVGKSQGVLLFLLIFKNKTKHWPSTFFTYYEGQWFGSSFWRWGKNQNTFWDAPDFMKIPIWKIHLVFDDLDVKLCTCWKYLTLNLTIYNIISWFAGSLGQMTHRTRVWCSNYYFFFTISCKILWKNRFNWFF